MVERFGTEILNADGTLNRGAVAQMVFAKDDATDAVRSTAAQARRALNEIVHPAVRGEIEARVAQHTDDGRLVVLDIPLLVEGLLRNETPPYGIRAVLVVDTPPELAVERLIAHRDFDRADAMARVSAQVSRSQRRSVADWVIDNSKDPAALDAEVARAWEWLQSLRATS